MSSQSVTDGCQVCAKHLGSGPLVRPMVFAWRLGEA